MVVHLFALKEPLELCCQESISNSEREIAGEDPFAVGATEIDPPICACDCWSIYAFVPKKGQNTRSVEHAALLIVSSRAPEDVQA